MTKLGRMVHLQIWALPPCCLRYPSSPTLDLESLFSLFAPTAHLIRLHNFLPCTVNYYAHIINHLSTFSVWKGQDLCQFTLIALQLLVLSSPESRLDVGDGKVQSDSTNTMRCSVQGGESEVKVKLLIHVRLFVIPWTAAYQVPPSMGFSRQEHWSGLPFSSPDLPDPGTEPGSPAL